MIELPRKSKLSMTSSELGPLKKICEQLDKEKIRGVEGTIDSEGKAWTYSLSRIEHDAPQTTRRNVHRIKTEEK